MIKNEPTYKLDTELKTRPRTTKELWLLPGWLVGLLMDAYKTKSVSLN